jgi:hypothetical protein
MAPGGRSIRLSEALEYVGQEFLGDSLTCVDDAHFEVAVHPCKTHLHPAGPRRELDGVREQVPDALLKPVGVSPYRPGHRIQDNLQSDPFRFGGMPHRFDGSGDNLLEVHALNVESHLAGNDPTHVQEIFDQLRLHFCIAIDDRQALFHFRVHLCA